MKFNILATMAVIGGLLHSQAHGDPVLSVTPKGINSFGNRTWIVSVAPDASLFEEIHTGGFGSPMAVELAFAIDYTNLVDIRANTVDWDFANPGHNPFTGTITEGLWVNPTGDRTFGAYGSRIFYSGDPVELFRITTQGSGLARIRWGTEASGHPEHGTIIAQLGGTFQTPPGESEWIEFTGLTGALAVPEPASVVLAALSVAAMAVALSRRRRS